MELRAGTMAISVVTRTEALSRTTATRGVGPDRSGSTLRTTLGTSLPSSSTTGKTPVS
ncbi:MAG: hypothetical protein HS104_36660 [Polyangiaceae bacterium]|nr:hypothetical protein [Polyangiaceae bacterium]